MNIEPLSKKIYNDAVNLRVEIIKLNFRCPFFECASCVFPRVRNRMHPHSASRPYGSPSPSDFKLSPDGLGNALCICPWECEIARLHIARDVLKCLVWSVADIQYNSAHP